MANHPQRRAALALVRFRARGRIRLRETQRQIGLGFDVALAIILFFIGLDVHTNSHLNESSRLPIEVLLGTFEVNYLLFRRILKRFNDLVRDSLTAIPRRNLAPTVFRHLDAQRVSLLERAHRLARENDCQLAKREMYAELIGLTETVTSTRAGYARGSIIAVSSTNIEDLSDEPLAEPYIQANKQAVTSLVDVRRVFIVTEDQSYDEEVRDILREHDRALRDERFPGRDTGVKWLLTTEAGADRREDFALFAEDALVEQAAGGQRFELSQDGEKISRALDVFDRLWSHQHAKTIDQLPNLRRRS